MKLAKNLNKIRLQYKIVINYKLLDGYISLKLFCEAQRNKCALVNHKCIRKMQKAGRKQIYFYKTDKNFHLIYKLEKMEGRVPFLKKAHCV